MKNIDFDNVKEYLNIHGFGVSEITEKESFGFLGRVFLSNGILYASENLCRPDWVIAITFALAQVLKNDAETFRMDEKTNQTSLYYVCPSPFSPDGKELDRCIVCRRDCGSDTPITTVCFAYED